MILAVSGSRRGGEPLGSMPGIDLDLPAVAGGDLVRDVSDGVLVLVADVVDPAGGGWSQQRDQLVDAVVDVAERAGLLAGALDRERRGGRRPRLGSSWFMRRQNSGMTCSRPMSGP